MQNIKIDFPQLIGKILEICVTISVRQGQEIFNVTSSLVIRVPKVMEVMKQDGRHRTETGFMAMYWFSTAAIKKITTNMAAGNNTRIHYPTVSMNQKFVFRLASCSAQDLMGLWSRCQLDFIFP